VIEGTDHDAPPAAPRARAQRIVGFVVGVALFGAAVWAITHGGADLEASLRAARSAHWSVVALVLGLPVLNWLLVSVAFRVLHSRYAPVGWGEMAALIGSAWLLNYLPLKPGMFGRIAYHKHVNGIRYADSARVIAISVGLSAGSIGALALIALLAGATGGGSWLWCVPVPVGLVALALATASRGPWAWRLAVAGLMRYLDMMVWIARYAAAFALVGIPLDFRTSLFVAVVSQVAIMLPIAGNGLGIREWGVRLATEPAGLLADVVNRAAELTVSLPIGVAGTVWATRRLGRARRGRTGGRVAGGGIGLDAGGDPSDESGRTFPGTRSS
jgi:hypothetical protein